MATSSNVTYKFDIIERMGGKTQYVMTVIDLSERLLQESKLKSFFDTIRMSSLCKMQDEILSLAISDLSEENKQRRLSRVLLHNYQLFDLGMNDEHFGIIADHLKGALRQSWAAENLIDDVIKCYNDLRLDIFGRSGDKKKGALEAMLGFRDEDEVEECELTLKKADEQDRGTPCHRRFAIRRRKNLDEANTSNTNAARSLSGENLLALLRLNDLKRSKLAHNSQ